MEGMRVSERPPRHTDQSKIRHVERSGRPGSPKTTEASTTHSITGVCTLKSKNLQGSADTVMPHAEQAMRWDSEEKHRRRKEVTRARSEVMERRGRIDDRWRVGA